MESLDQKMHGALDEIRKRVDEIRGHATKAAELEAEVGSLISAVRSCAETALKTGEAMAEAASTFRGAMATMEKSMADAIQGLKGQGQHLIESSERCASAAKQVEQNTIVLQEAYRAGIEQLKSAGRVGMDEGLAAQRGFFQEELKELLLKLQEQNRPWWRRRG